MTPRDAESVCLEYVSLHRRPLKLCRTRAMRADPSLGRGDLRAWDGVGGKQYYLTLVYCDVRRRDTVDRPGLVVVRVPL